MEAPPRVALFCDGSCVGNGGASASAAWSLCIVEDGVETVARAERLSPTEKHTNQRAEAHGMARAVQEWIARSPAWVASGVRHAPIVSDSEYAVRGANEYWPRWGPAEWEAKSNVDILVPLWADIQRARSMHPTLELVIQWTKAHATDGGWKTRGNTRADKLALAAVRGATSGGGGGPPPPPPKRSRADDDDDGRYTAAPQPRPPASASSSSTAAPAAPHLASAAAAAAEAAARPAKKPRVSVADDADDVWILGVHRKDQRESTEVAAFVTTARALGWRVQLVERGAEAAALRTFPPTALVCMLDAQDVIVTASPRGVFARRG